MGYRTKIQLIQRKNSKQWYVTLPSACAQMMGFEKGETVEWLLEEEGKLVLKRLKKMAPGTKD